MFFNDVAPRFCVGTAMGANIDEVMCNPDVRCILKCRRDLLLQLLCENAEPASRDNVYEIGEADFACVVGTVDRYGREKVKSAEIGRLLKDCNQFASGFDSDVKLHVIYDLAYCGDELRTCKLTEKELEDIEALYSSRMDPYVIQVGWAFPRSMGDGAAFVEVGSFFQMTSGDVCRVERILVHQVYLDEEQTYRCTVHLALCRQYLEFHEAESDISGCTRHRVCADRRDLFFSDINNIVCFEHMVYRNRLPYCHRNKFYIR
jgi:hypothetical protein